MLSSGKPKGGMLSSGKPKGDVTVLMENIITSGCQ